MIFGLHPEAQAEYRIAAKRYHRDSPARAFRFEACVEETFERIRANPRQWRRIGPGIHKCVVRAKFPYHVVYVVRPELVVVIAVAHDKRQPGYWSRRLTDQFIP